MLYSNVGRLRFTYETRGNQEAERSNDAESVRKTEPEAQGGNGEKQADELAKVEADWEEKIDDYIVENYPHHDGVRARTKEEQAAYDAETKAMKHDKTLAKMRKDADEAFEKSDEAFKKALDEEADYIDGKDEKPKTAAEKKKEVSANPMEKMQEAANDYKQEQIDKASKSIATDITKQTGNVAKASNNKNQLQKRPLLDEPVDPVVWMRQHPGQLPNSSDLFGNKQSKEQLGKEIGRQSKTTDKGVVISRIDCEGGYVLEARHGIDYILQPYYPDGQVMTRVKFDIGGDKEVFKKYVHFDEKGPYIIKSELLNQFMDVVDKKNRSLGRTYVDNRKESENPTFMPKEPKPSNPIDKAADDFKDGADSKDVDPRKIRKEPSVPTDPVKGMEKAAEEYRQEQLKRGGQQREQTERGVIAVINPIINTFKKDPRKAREDLEALIAGFNEEELKIATRVVMNTYLGCDKRGLAADDWHRAATDAVRASLEARGVIIRKGSKGLAEGDSIIDRDGFIRRVVAQKGSKFLVEDEDSSEPIEVKRSEVKYYFHPQKGETGSPKDLILRKVGAEEIKATAKKLDVNETWLSRYAESMKEKNSDAAVDALEGIKEEYLREHSNEKTAIIRRDGVSSSVADNRLFAPIEKAIKEKYGDVDVLIEEIRKRAEEFSLLSDEDLDKRYMDALGNGDEAMARELLAAAARRKGYGDIYSAYQSEGVWAAPSKWRQYKTDEARREAAAIETPDLNIEDMAAGYSYMPMDIFEHPEKYDQEFATSAESGKVIQTAIDEVKSGKDEVKSGKKDVKVKVYRAVPTSVKEGKLRNGDWVTPSRKYAEMHGENHLGGKYRIIEDEVPAKELWWDGNDVNEWGYDNGKSYKYKNAKNNRKSNDLVTRDDKGEVIPPSKRFNSRKADERYQKAEDAKNASKREQALRDAVVETMKSAGLDVSMDAEEGQRVLDEVNGEVRMSAKKRRALETVSVSQDEKHQPTVVSSADGAKVLKKLDSTKEKYENQSNRTNTFLGDVAKALGAQRHGSSSEYVTFETKNGRIVTIRLANHNAKVSNFDANGEADGISIVVTAKQNERMTDDGMAHVVEYYYDAIKLRRADGKPLAEIVRSIKQALYSGEFTDTTGLAERQEVNADDVTRYQKVFHGSGAEFDHFDHSHMGEGEGAQAYGWGTYVTEVEGIGRTYAKASKYNIQLRISELEANISRTERSLPFLKGETKEEEQRLISQWKEELDKLRGEEEKGQYHLYTVEVPDDTGENYLSWDRPLTEKQFETINKALAHLMDSPAIPDRLKEKLREWNNGYAPVIDIQKGNTGKEVYEAIKAEILDEYTSKFLSSLGFAGIKYPADYLRGGREDGKSNYVIFNEKDAKITDHVRFFRTSNGEAYGYTIGGKIYIDPRIANSETPVHEYAHLWATALRSGNAEEWQNVVGLMKGTSVWDEVKKRYPELKADDDIADEVLAAYSGRRGAERLREEMDNAKGDAKSALQRVKEAIGRFWKATADMLHIHYKSAEEVADRVMKDLLDGVDPRKMGVDEKVRQQFIGERGAEKADHAEEVNIRMNNLSVARQMEDDGKDAKVIKLATGWERGADGKWRYEILDGIYHPKDDAELKKALAKQPWSEELNGLSDRILDGEELSKEETERFNELVEEEAAFKADYLKKEKPHLADWLENDELFKAYPELKRVGIVFTDNMPKEQAGYYSRSENEIVINANSYVRPESVIAHEIQHAIQHEEGFVRGGSVEGIEQKFQKAKAEWRARAYAHELEEMAKELGEEYNQLKVEKALIKELEDMDMSELIPDKETRIKGFNYFVRGYADRSMDDAIKQFRLDTSLRGNFNPYLEYRKLGGEVEARNVQGRMAMSPEERRRSLAEETEDIAREDQIFLSGGDTAAMSFGEPYDYGKYPLGRVEPNLSEKEVKVVKADANHGFVNYKDAKAWAKEHVAKVYDNEETGGKGEVRISNTAIDKFMSQSAVDKSDSKDVHMAVLKVLPDVLKSSIDVETHPDFLKGEDGKRKAENGMNKDVLVHRCYGAVTIDGKPYRVKITLKEDPRDLSSPHITHSYEATKIELLAGTWENQEGPSPNTNNSISAAKLLNGVEKSYDSGKKLLDESKDLTEGDTYFKDINTNSSIADDAPLVVKHVDKIAKKLGSNVNMVNSPEEVTNKEARERIERGENVTGWYDEKTGEVHLYMPNIHDRYTAEKTIWHEVVGHKGMRGLFGDKFDDFLRSIYYDLDKPENAELKKLVDEERKYNPLNIYDSIEEGIARLAEDGKGEVGFWNTIKNKVTDLLHEIGYRIAPNTKDVKYLLWLSKNLQKNPNSPYWKLKANAVRYKLENEKLTTIKNGTYADNDSKVKNYEGFTRKDWEEAADMTVHFRTTPSAATEIEIYNRAVGNVKAMAEEAYSDKMNSILELYKAIDPSIKRAEDVKTSENPYIMENLMSSRAQQVGNAFVRDKMDPLTKAFNNILDSFSGKDMDDSIRNANLYLVKKSGLERNRAFFVRDSIRKLARNEATMGDAKQLQADWDAEHKRLKSELDKKQITLKGYFDGLDDFIRKNVDSKYDPNKNDYSGFHEMQNILNNQDIDDALIQDEVMSAESSIGSDSKVDELWNTIKAATDDSLHMDYCGGFMDKEMYQRVSDEMNWYVPMRMFDQETAEDVYGYVDSNGGRSGFVGPALMRAKGRESLSSLNILAQIGAMGEYAINRSARNAIKQAFMRFVNNNEKAPVEERLVTEINPWFEKVTVNGVDTWEERFPAIPDDATQLEIGQAVENFESAMEAKEAKGEAKRGVRRGNINYKFADKNHRPQHIVDVWVNGRKKSYVINGNPRAAQAINGMLDHKGAHNWLSKSNRWLSQVCTSYNPEFTIRNAIRDYGFATNTLLAKEGAAYMLKFEKHYAALGLSPIINTAKGVGNANLGDIKNALAVSLFKQYKNGTLDVTKSKYHKWFKEFMDNGGETGYLQMKNVDAWKKKIDTDIKDMRKGKLQKFNPVKAMVGLVEDMNQMAENIARFATFCASRESGRNATRSAYDAKEVSVNFNRSGSAENVKSYKYEDMGKGSERARNAFGFSSCYLRNYTMFFNASVQSFKGLCRNVQKAPARTIASMVAVPMSLGLLMPLVNRMLYGLLDDDEKDRKGVKDPYAELPDYIRRYNLCIYAGKGRFIQVPIAIEGRAFYGLGDIAASYTYKKDLKETRSLPLDIANQLAQIVPVGSFMESSSTSGDTKAFLSSLGTTFLPSVASPVLELAFNRDWKGQPIYNDATYVENAPAWKKAYSGTSDVFAWANKKANALTNDVDPGNENMRGSTIADALTNPFVWEQLFDSYVGGMGTFATRTAVTIGHALDKNKEVEVENIPFARSLFYTPSSRTSLQRTKSKWYNYKDEVETTNYNLGQLKRDSKDPLIGLQSANAWFRYTNSSKSEKANIVNDYDSRIKKLNQILKVTADNDAIKKIEEEKDKLMQEAVAKLDSLDD